jgi:hypothetical protein
MQSIIQSKQVTAYELWQFDSHAQNYCQLKISFRQGTIVLNRLLVHALVSSCCSGLFLKKLKFISRGMYDTESS